MNMASMGMETQDETPPGALPVPLKMTGIGNVHMRITATPEAQMWFNQGLNLLHDFWDYESARAFEQSVRVDPQCAMCYWGLYKAESFTTAQLEAMPAARWPGPSILNATQVSASFFTLRRARRKRMPPRKPRQVQTFRRC